MHTIFEYGNLQWKEFLLLARSPNAKPWINAKGFDLCNNDVYVLAAAGVMNGISASSLNISHPIIFEILIAILEMTRCWGQFQWTMVDRTAIICSDQCGLRYFFLAESATNVFLICVNWVPKNTLNVCLNILKSLFEEVAGWAQTVSLSV